MVNDTADGPALGFPPSARLRRRAEFQRVQARGQRLVLTHFIVFVHRTGGAHSARLGITVSKKVGHAPIRSRWKRLVREAFRRLRPELAPGLDIVVIGRPGVPEPDFDVVGHALRGALLRTRQRDR